MAESEMKHYSLAEFEAIATERFGEDRMKWRFVCPACGHVQTAEDYKAAGAPPNAVAYSCVGRWIEGSRDAFSEGPGPCNYAGGGLFRIHRATANGTPVFELAEEPEASGKRLSDQEAYALILADAFTANHVLVRYSDGIIRRESAKDMSHVGKGFRFWSDNDRARYDGLTRLLRRGCAHIEEVAS